MFESTYLCGGLQRFLVSSLYLLCVLHLAGHRNIMKDSANLFGSGLLPGYWDSAAILVYESASITYWRKLEPDEEPCVAQVVAIPFSFTVGYSMDPLPGQVA